MEEKKREKKQQVSKERQRNVLKFEWDAHEDTYEQSQDSLYGRIGWKPVREEQHLKEVWSEKKLEDMSERDW